MRLVLGIALLALAGLAACADANQGNAPCPPPLTIDSTGACVSQPEFGMDRRR